MTSNRKDAILRNLNVLDNFIVLLEAHWAKTMGKIEQVDFDEIMSAIGCESCDVAELLRGVIGIYQTTDVFTDSDLEMMLMIYRDEGQITQEEHTELVQLGGL